LLLLTPKSNRIAGKYLILDVSKVTAPHFIPIQSPVLLSFCAEPGISAGTTYLTMVSKRAEELKATEIVSQKGAQEIRMDVLIKLREAIEQSKAVENTNIIRCNTNHILQDKPACSECGN
jgi:hypothetical protein